MRNYTVASVWDIPIRINVSLLVFLPVLAYLVGSGEQIALYAGFIEALTGVGFDLEALNAGTTPWAIGFAAAVGLFVSVTLHELGHAWVALRYGVGIESITLWILGGIASLTAVPREWNREFWIAIAGPIVSAAVGVVCLGGVVAVPSSLPVAQYVLGWIGVANIALVGFNLLPAFPMDGGRILRALLARRRPYASATRIAGRVGVLFALLFAVVGVLNFNVVLLLVALFVYGAATTESRTVLIDELLDGITVGDIATRDSPTVADDAAVAALADRMLRERRTTYLVTGGGGATRGVVSLPDLRDVRPEDRETTTVGSVARDLPRLDAATDAFDALGLLQRARVTEALVEEDGTVVGVLSEADYANAITFQEGLPTRHAA